MEPQKQAHPPTIAWDRKIGIINRFLESFLNFNLFEFEIFEDKTSLDGRLNYEKFKESRENSPGPRIESFHQ